MKSPSHPSVFGSFWTALSGQMTQSYPLSKPSIARNMREFIGENELYRTITQRNRMENQRTPERMEKYLDQLYDYQRQYLQGVIE